MSDTYGFVVFLIGDDCCVLQDDEKRGSENEEMRYEG